jgi:hypothetical protein
MAQLTPPSPPFREIVQLVTVGDPEQTTPPVIPPVSVRPSILDPIPSKTTTLALCGSFGVSAILIVVTSAPASDFTTMFFTGGLAGLFGSCSRLKLIGSVITYSPGLTSTVSLSAAASMPILNHILKRTRLEEFLGQYLREDGPPAFLTSR